MIQGRRYCQLVFSVWTISISMSTGNILFIVLTLAVVVAVILVADSLLNAMIIVSLLANFLVISAQFGKISRGSLGIAAQDWGVPPRKEMPDDDSEEGITRRVDAYEQRLAREVARGTSSEPDRTPDGSQPVDMYGPFYEMWHAYHDTSAYPTPQHHVGVSSAEVNSGIDAAAAYMSQQRARDKRCSDGWASKNADYYAYHFGSELAQAEAKPWWGASEY
jgi:hypothetical protein